MAAYKVLYRKYRPRFFADVVGQPHVTVTLKNELTRGRIAHAYLFTGSRGTGKTTCAKILARAVNCLNPQNGDPCGECAVCKGLEDGSILDVVEIDAASNNGVDSIRTLIEESNFTPATAKYRVYIIDEVHMLSAPAFNALLKTLEEPPAHVIFILATTEVHKLLPTILSRCQRFDFRRISPEDIADRLDYVAKAEHAQIDREAALLIARIADGAMRDALSLLDQCLGRDEHVTLEVVSRTAGVAAREYLADFAQAIAEQNCGRALELIDQLHRESKDMSRLCEELAEYFRGLMLLKTMQNAAPLVSAGPRELEQMTRQALSMRLSSILRGLDVFEEALNRMRYANPRTQLEMAFVRLCAPELDSTSEALLRRIEALEQGAPRRIAAAPTAPQAKEAVPPAPKAEEAPAVKPEEPPKESPEPAEEPPAAPEPAEDPPALSEEPPEVFAPPVTAEQPPEPPQPAPKKAPQKPAPKVDIEALSANAQRFRDWEEVLKLFKGGAKSVEMSFANSAAYISGDYMLIEATDFAFDLLKGREQRNRMREAIQQVTGKAYKLGPYTKPRPAEETDGLDELTRRAMESGISVSEETNDDPQEELSIPF